MDKRIAVAASKDMPKSKVVWKCQAVQDQDPREFSEHLQECLQTNTDAGFDLYSLLPRQEQNALVLVFQKVEHPTIKELYEAGMKIPEHVLQRYGLSDEADTSGDPDPTVN